MFALDCSLWWLRLFGAPSIFSLDEGDCSVYMEHEGDQMVEIVGLLCGGFIRKVLRWWGGQETHDIASD